MPGVLIPLLVFIHSQILCLMPQAYLFVKPTPPLHHKKFPFPFHHLPQNDKIFPIVRIRLILVILQLRKSLPPIPSLYRGFTILQKKHHLVVNLVGVLVLIITNLLSLQLEVVLPPNVKKLKLPHHVTHTVILFP